MTFMPPIIAPIVAPLATPGGAVVPWYLLGGVTSAQCMVAYQPKGAADLAASYINLNNPGTNNAAPGTAPTFATATGWTFAAASTQYLKTGVVIGSNYSVLIRVDSSTFAAANRIVGSQDAGGVIFFIGQNVGTERRYRYGASAVGVTGSCVGVLSVAGANAYYYASGSLTTDATTLNNTASTTYDLYIGCINAIGTPGTYSSIIVSAFAIYNITLSSTQVGLIAAAMAAL